MGFRVRVIFVALGVAAALLAVGYFLQQPWALASWPWSEGRLSNVFIASMLAAIAAAMLWIGIANQAAASAPGLLHLAVILVGIAGVVGIAGAQRGDAGLMIYAAGATIVVVACLALFRWARSQTPRDTRPLTRMMRVWFALYIVILFAAGSALVVRVSGIMPWPLKGETSTIYGFIFLAAIVSFAYPLLHPQFEYANVGLVGFLAYDAVLLPPLVGHLERVQPALMTSLVLYITALAVSGAVSAYYLLHKPKSEG